MNVEDLEFNVNLEGAIAETEGSSAFRRDRDRPYDGQPWTSAGFRGFTEVQGLSMRDVRDCLDYAIVDCIIPGETTFADIDPAALGQNLCCWIEKMMGIYPNAPPIENMEEFLSNLPTVKLPPEGD